MCRLDYIHILEDLLEMTGRGGDDQLVGLDIGTGASCIYPLLGCSLHPSWSFIATDVDLVSYEAARTNVEDNQLSESIQLCLNKQGDPLLVKDHFDFCLCNPPFYSSLEEIGQKRLEKKTASRAQRKYSRIESVCAGGETAFVRRIIDESLLRRDECLWFTSLLGLKSSTHQLFAILKQLEPRPFVKIVPSQVGSTRRWILAWSWKATKSKSFKTRQLTLTVKDPAALEKVFEELQLGNPGQNRYQIDAITWGRRARRHGQQTVSPFVFTTTFSGENTVSFSLEDPVNDSNWDHLVSLVNYIKTLNNTKSF